ncbi:MAG TPA: HAD family hydrolase [Bacteroidota bacterium]|nr:HAD family hydrolase [Bacteroidota bacterium]
MKAVLFDFGGTIDTDGVHWSEKFWEYYEHFGVEVTKTAFEEAFVQSENMIVKYADLPKLTFYKTLHKQFALQFAALKMENEGDLLKSMADACYQDVSRIMQKAQKILEELHQQFRLGVVSNFYGNLEVVCREFKLEMFFRTIVDSAVVGIRKPDSAIWQLALDNLAVRPADAWVVGDSYERDILPAKKLGCSTVWLQGKSWSKPPSSDAADHVIHKFEELKKVVLSGR